MHIDTGSLKFNEKGLIPAIAQDVKTGEVLMMAWMNAQAIEKTVSTGKAHYYSRSRDSLWLKGETSGNFQQVRSVLYDCDGDTILLMVESKGPACHTGERTCFYRAIDGAPKARPEGARVLTELAAVLEARKKAAPESSYVASLYAKGLPKILAKIEEEAGELVEAAAVKGDKEVLYEFCDLLFHSMVLLAQKGIAIDEAYSELGRRFGISGIDEKNSRGER